MPVAKYLPAVIRAIRNAQLLELQGTPLVDAIVANLCRELGGQVIYLPQYRGPELLHPQPIRKPCAVVRVQSDIPKS